MTRLAWSLEDVASDADALAARAQEAEMLDLESVWLPERCGLDFAVVLGWLAGLTSTIGLGAVLSPLDSRTPTCAAMSIVGVDRLAASRLLVALEHDTKRFAEYATIVRAVIGRTGKLEHKGEAYRVPYDGADATGLAKRMKLVTEGPRRSVPLAAALTDEGYSALGGDGASALGGADSAYVSVSSLEAAPPLPHGLPLTVELDVADVLAPEGRAALVRLAPERVVLRGASSDDVRSVLEVWP